MIQILHSNEQQYKEYPQRYMIATTFFLLSFINGACWVVVSPIIIPVAKAYNQPSQIVSLIPTLYMLFYVLVNFPSNWLLDVKGIKAGILLGAILTSLGAAIRVFAFANFYFVIAGQILCAIAQPIILNATTKVAVRWFLPQNRGLIIAVLSISNLIGTAFGFVLPSLFVSNIASKSTVQDEFTLLLLTEFIITVVPLIMALGWFVESPPTPTSQTSQLQQSGDCQQIKDLFKNYQFVILFIAFGCIMGPFNQLASMVDLILHYYSYSSSQISFFIAVCIITGMLSSLLFGYIIEKTLKYSLLFKILAFLALIQCISLPIILIYGSKNFPLMLAFFIILGFTFLPFIPLTLSYGSDILYPFGEAQITGCILTSGQFFSIIQIFISENWLKLGYTNNTYKENKAAALHTVIFCCVMIFIGAALYFFFNGELKRSKIQNQIVENDTNCIE